MSSELERRLGELSQERARLRESIRRIGAIFASNLDRPALLELALQTAVDAVEAECGRVSFRSGDGATLSETSSVGSLAGFEDGVYEAERAALRTESLGEGVAGDVNVISVAIGTPESGAPTHGLITAGRRARPYSDDEREVLGRSPLRQHWRSRTSIWISRSDARRSPMSSPAWPAAGAFRSCSALRSTRFAATTTPSASSCSTSTTSSRQRHLRSPAGRRRAQGGHSYRARELARSRLAGPDGGEEMALILPHTDLVGAHAIGERVRTAIAAHRIPRIDRDGTLRTTASVGVAASREGDEDTLVAAADAALYEAKRQGKNRTISASARAANVSGAQ
jgi:hypothetical protein